MIKTLSNDDARRLFQTARVGRLGCVVNGEPYVVPISFHLDGDSCYVHSLPGLKISGLRENPRACVQVDQVENDLRWRSAIAFGVYEEITKPDERANILKKLLREFPMLTPVEAAITIDGAPPQPIVYRIKIERLTGVSEG